MAGQRIDITQKLNDLSLLKKPMNPTGFKLINYSFLPHWGLDDFKTEYIRDSFDILYSSAYPLIAINNHEYVEVKDDKWQIVDVRRESWNISS